MMAKKSYKVKSTFSYAGKLHPLGSKVRVEDGDTDYMKACRDYLEGAPEPKDPDEDTQPTDNAMNEPAHAGDTSE
jgi:hypothetical protein